MPGPPRETSFLFATLNSTRPEVYFWRGQDLMAIDSTNNRERKLYHADERFMVNMLNVTADGKYVCTALFEDLSAKLQVDLLHGYVGFAKYWEAMPLSVLLRRRA